MEAVRNTGCTLKTREKTACKKKLVIETEPTELEPNTHLRCIKQKMKLEKHPSKKLQTLDQVNKVQTLEAILIRNT